MSQATRDPVRARRTAPRRGAIVALLVTAVALAAIVLLGAVPGPLGTAIAVVLPGSGSRSSLWWSARCSCVRGPPGSPRSRSSPGPSHCGVPARALAGRPRSGRRTARRHTERRGRIRYRGGLGADTGRRRGAAPRVHRAGRRLGCGDRGRARRRLPARVPRGHRGRVEQVPDHRSGGARPRAGLEAGPAGDRGSAERTGERLRRARRIAAPRRAERTRRHAVRAGRADPR